ncbi:MAG: NAD(+) synthase [Oscillospiraceae bacterium]|nr:NAD(+) synthase [Oscillospiraceae bacterium]
MSSHIDTIYIRMGDSGKGVKVAACSPKLKIADPSFNALQINEDIVGAVSEGCRVVLFPELSLTSCSCGSLFSFHTLLDSAYDALNYILRSCSEYDTYIIVGLPLMDNNKVYNCATILYNGNVVSYIAKHNVYPSSAISYSFSQYTGSEKDSIFSEDFSFLVDDIRFRVIIGDDIDNFVYDNSVILNPSSLPVIAGGYSDYKNKILSYSAEACGIVSVNPSYFESSSRHVFASTAIAATNGQLLMERRPFKNNSVYCTFSGEYTRCEWHEPKRRSNEYTRTPFIPENAKQYLDDILQIQAHALARRFIHIGCDRMVLGISGGLDSTLTLLAAANTATLLGESPKDVVTAISMPSISSSARTKNNAAALSIALGVDFRTIDISESLLLHLKDIGHDGIATDTTYENAQARERTQILLDICNMENGIMIGSGDLSELALGFTTFGGDLLSMYGINASIPKTVVKALVIHWADILQGDIKQILYDIADTPISPELIPSINNSISQRTEDILGPYEIHDFFIWQMFVYHRRPTEIYAAACEVFDTIYQSVDILNWLEIFYRRFFMSQFKRISLSESPNITGVNLSDFDMPGDVTAAAWMKELESIKKSI